MFLHFAHACVRGEARRQDYWISSSSIIDQSTEFPNALSSLVRGREADAVRISQAICAKIGLLLLGRERNEREYEKMLTHLRSS